METIETGSRDRLEMQASDGDYRDRLERQARETGLRWRL